MALFRLESALPTCPRRSLPLLYLPDEGSEFVRNNHIMACIKTCGFTKMVEDSIPDFPWILFQAGKGFI